MTRDEFLTKAMGTYKAPYMIHEWFYHDKYTYFKHWTTTGPTEEDQEGSERKVVPSVPNFSSPLEWTALLLWSQDDARTYVNQGGPEKWTWGEFELWARTTWASQYAEGAYTYGTATSAYTRWLFNPERFAPLLAEFLGWREGK